MEQKKVLTNVWVVYILAVLTCLLKGTAIPMIKLGYQYFHIPQDEVASQILIIGIRFFLSGIMLLIVGSLLYRTFLLPKPIAMKGIVITGLLQTVLQNAFFSVGLAFTTGVKGSIIIGSNVFFTILIATLMFRMEKLSLLKLTGCIIGFIGIILINLNGLEQGFSFVTIGDGLIILAALSSAFSNVYLKRISHLDSVITINSYQFLIGGFVMILIGLLMGGRLTVVSPAAIGVLLYLSFSSAASYTIWIHLIKHNPVSKITVFSFMNPFFGFLFSSILLEESQQVLNAMTFISLILVCVGIYAVNKAKTS